MGLPMATCCLPLVSDKQLSERVLADGTCHPPSARNLTGKAKDPFPRLGSGPAPRAAGKAHHDTPLHTRIVGLDATVSKRVKKHLPVSVDECVQEDRWMLHMGCRCYVCVCVCVSYE